MAVAVLTMSLLVTGCSSEDAPSAPASTEQPSPQPVENKVAVVTSPTEPSQRPVIPGQSAAQSASEDQAHESPPAQSIEPRADEIARTIELETELSEIVQTASAMLDPDQAQALLSRADRWAQDGFDCPDGAGREACRQSNIRNLIKEIDNRMRGFKTEY